MTERVVESIVVGLVVFVWMGVCWSVAALIGWSTDVSRADMAFVMSSMLAALWVHDAVRSVEGSDD